MIRLQRLPAFLATTILLAASVTSAQADGPAVSALNGKLSSEGGVTGSHGQSSGIGMVQGSIAAPLGHALGFQLDGLAGTAFNATFGGGTAHLFWRDPAIGLFGPVVSMTVDGGERLGWYGTEAELYVGRLTFGACGGYHDAVDNSFGIAASSGFYGGSLTVYPLPDLALSAGVTSAFSRVAGTGTLEFQPDLFARHNVAFFVNGEVADQSTYSVTADIRIYFGADKPLIRRHREDDPVTSSAAVHPLQVAANRNAFVGLVRSNFLGHNAPAIQAFESQYEEMWARDVAAMVGIGRRGYDGKSSTDNGCG